jgi:hypothetical protein
MTIRALLCKHRYFDLINSSTQAAVRRTAVNCVTVFLNTFLCGKYLKFEPKFNVNFNTCCTNSNFSHVSNITFLES